MKNKKYSGQRDFNLWNLIGILDVSISDEGIEGQSVLDEHLSKMKGNMTQHLRNDGQYLLLSWNLQKSSYEHLYFLILG